MNRINKDVNYLMDYLIDDGVAVYADNAELLMKFSELYMGGQQYDDIYDAGSENKRQFGLVKRATLFLGLTDMKEQEYANLLMIVVHGYEKTSEDYAMTYETFGMLPEYTRVERVGEVTEKLFDLLFEGTKTENQFYRRGFVDKPLL